MYKYAVCSRLCQHKNAGGVAGKELERLLVLRATISGMKNRTTLILLLMFFLTLACSAADFTVKKIGEGVYAAVSPDGGKAGSNAGFIIGSNGVALVPTFVAAYPAKDLRRQTPTVTPLPPT